MKIKQFRVAAICMFGLLTLASCSPDWGQADPPAANEIYPELKEVEGSALTFEYDEETVPLSEFDKQVGDLIEVVQDDTLASNVLHLDSACYVRKANPFKGQSLQTGAGITFYVKTAQFDASSPLLTIGGEPNDTLDSFYFTENSQLVFTKGDIHQLQSKNLNVNDPSEVITNAVPGGGWHFVALQLKNDGYVMYVDGVKESEQTFTPERDTQFKYADLIEHLTTAPYLYIGSDKLCEAYFDDFKFYCNVMTDKEWNKTVNGGGSSAGDSPLDIWNYIKGYYIPAGSGSLLDGITGSLEAKLVTDETQQTVSSFENDDERGLVWHQQEGWSGHENGKSHLDFTNPLAGLSLSDGATIAFWVKQPAVNWWDTIFGMTDGVGHLWFNGNGYLGVNANEQWIDVQQGNNVNSIPDNTWTHVALVFTSTGMTVYHNGQVKFTESDNAAVASSGPIEYDKVLSFISSCPTASLGYGSFWGSANSYVSDVVFLSRAATDRDVAYLMFLGDMTPKGMFLLKSNFVNVLNPVSNDGIVSVETQTTKSAFENDEERGSVWHQQEGWVGHANGLAYINLHNPLIGANLSNGATISFWVRQPAINWWDTIFGITDGMGHLWFNGNGYLGVNANDQWIDIQNNNNTNELPADTWTQVTIVFISSGITVYYNGVEKFTESSNGAVASSGPINYSTILNYIQSAANISFGYGSFWGCANAYVSNCFVYGSAMTAEQVMQNYWNTVK